MEPYTGEVVRELSDIAEDLQKRYFEIKKTPGYPEAVEEVLDGKSKARATNDTSGGRMLLKLSANERARRRNCRKRQRKARKKSRR